MPAIAARVGAIAGRVEARRSVIVGTPALVAGCVAVAALTLALPSAPGFDPWAWVVWGRELARGALDTTAGPSWKPLPVLFTAVFSVFGDAAPELWLVVARAGGLLAMALAYRLAARQAGPGAGVVACLALLLAPDGEARWLRHLAQGNSEPLLVALCLWAIERHQDGRRDHAVALAVAAALVRPEVWPFLGLYAVWLWRRDPSQRRLLAVLLPLVPLLWFGGDWLGSGSLFTGADRAQVVPGGIVRRTALALQRIGDTVILPVWLGAAVAVGLALQRRERATLGLAAAALAWAALVATMTIAFGYAALSRFLAPTAAVLCVLAGIAAARVVASARGRATRLAVAGILLVVAVPFALPRILAIGTQAEAATARARLGHGLSIALQRAGGRSTVLECGAPVVDTAVVAFDAWPELAWKLDVALAGVRHGLGDRTGVLFTASGGPLDRDHSSRPRPGVQPLARSHGWAVLAVGCPARAPAQQPGDPAHPTVSVPSMPFS